jgi:hypothetical protein
MSCGSASLPTVASALASRAARARRDGSASVANTRLSCPCSHPPVVFNSSVDHEARPPTRPWSTRRLRKVATRRAGWRPPSRAVRRLTRAVQAAASPDRHRRLHGACGLRRAAAGPSPSRGVVVGQERRRASSDGPKRSCSPAIPTRSRWLNRELARWPTQGRRGSCNGAATEPCDPMTPRRRPRVRARPPKLFCAAQPGGTQDTAARTSAATVSSTSGVHVTSANPTGQRSPSSRWAESWNSRVE